MSAPIWLQLKDMLAQGGIYKNIEKVINTCISSRVMRPDIRNEDVDTVDEHLPDDLFGYIEQPETNPDMRYENVVLSTRR
jgi:hypothetical protein